MLVAYHVAIRQLTEHYPTHPGHLSERDLRQYFLYLAHEKEAAPLLALRGTPLVSLRLRWSQHVAF